MKFLINRVMWSATERRFQHSMPTIYHALIANSRKFSSMWISTNIIVWQKDMIFVNRRRKAHSKFDTVIMFPWKKFALSTDDNIISTHSSRFTEKNLFSVFQKKIICCVFMSKSREENIKTFVSIWISEFVI